MAYDFRWGGDWICQFSTGMPLPAMIERIVPKGSTRFLWSATMTCFPVAEFRHFWWLPAWPTRVKPFLFRIDVTCAAVSRGVFRSPNGDLVELGARG